MALQLLIAMPHASAIVDEPAHIASGWLALTQGDLRVNREHPPLAKVAAALAILPMAPFTSADSAKRAPGGIDRTGEDFAFDFSRQFLYRDNASKPLLQAARLPIVLLCLACHVIVAVWGWRLFGPMGGLAAAALFAFEPNLLAHGRLVTTDMAASLFTIAVFAALERALAPGPRANLWTIVAGAALGLALLSRFSSILIPPILLLVTALDGRLSLRRRLVRLAIVILTGVLLVHLGYAGIAACGNPEDGGFLQSLPLSFFPLAHPSSSAGKLLSEPLVSMESSPALRWLPIPLPRLYLEGLDLARFKNRHVEGPGYLNGSISATGWWSWYALALMMKGTLPFLLLATIGMALWAGASGRHGTEILYVALPAICLFGMVTALTRAQIGLRYILPVLPFLCLAGGRAAAWLTAAGATRRLKVAGMTTLCALLLWHAGAALSIHPYHLAYFNEAAGGPSQGWRRLVDSNLDWGQDLIGLRRFLTDHGQDRVNLYYFGTADPAALGIQRAVPPEPGWFAVSATHLAGVYLPDSDYLAPFRSMRPHAHVGYSIFLYRLDTVPPFLTVPPRKR